MIMVEKEMWAILEMKNIYTENPSVWRIINGYTFLFVHVFTAMHQVGLFLEGIMFSFASFSSCSLPLYPTKAPPLQKSDNNSQS